MRFNRTSRVFLALLLAAILPLRAFAVAHCEPAQSFAGAASVHTGHCAQAPLHARGCSDHGCGDCCCMAAGTPVLARWDLPHAPASDISARLILPPPALAPDRLDRPPRLLRAR
jgi:hypothetical protein